MANEQPKGVVKHKRPHPLPGTGNPGHKKHEKQGAKSKYGQLVNSWKPYQTYPATDPYEEVSAPSAPQDFGQKENTKALDISSAEKGTA